MPIRVAINGFGRIGRLLLHTLYKYYHPQVKVVAINSKNPLEDYLYYAQYDSVHGKLCCSIKIKDNNMLIDSSVNNRLQENIDHVKLSSSLEIQNLPWQELDVDLVYECTGVYKVVKQLLQYMKVGVKKVLVSANIKDAVKTVVYGVNHHILNNNDQIVSNASCTTNCAAFVLEALLQQFTISVANFITVHSYTADQSLVDSNHADLARSRAAALNIIPTSTNLSQTLHKIFPNLGAKLTCSALRVPVANVSYLVGTIQINQSISTKELHTILRNFANNKQVLYGIQLSTLSQDLQSNTAYFVNDDYTMPQLISYTDLPNVSTDFNSYSASTVFDLSQTKMLAPNLLQVYAWYDNEWAYACRMHEVAQYLYSIS